MNIFEFFTKPRCKIGNYDIDLATMLSCVLAIGAGIVGDIRFKNEINKSVRAVMAEQNNSNGGAQKGE